MRLAKVFLRLTRRESELDAYRARPYPRAAPVKPSLREFCDVRERQVQGRPVYDLTPKHGASDWHFIYTHGGGYTGALVSAHWDVVESLVRLTGASVTVPLYPLTPEHTYEAAYSLLEAVYRDLLSRTPAEKIVLCGDSAGGALALGQAIHARDTALPSPGRVVLFAPWLDLALSDPEIEKVEPRDVMLRADRLRVKGRWWAGNADRTGPLLSPMYADLRGLPPIDVFHGTDDLLIVDARTFHRQALRVGADVRLYETPGGFHVFMGAPWIPEARDVYRQIARNLEVPLEART